MLKMNNEPPEVSQGAATCSCLPVAMRKVLLSVVPPPDESSPHAAKPTTAAPAATAAAPCTKCRREIADEAISLISSLISDMYFPLFGNW